MVHVIYFNQWFSSAAWIMKSLKQDFGDSIRIVASSKNPNHSYKNYVDKFIVEDWENNINTRTDTNTDEAMNNYVEYILKLCLENNVDYFFVKKNAHAIMKNSAEFSMHGITLISENKTVLDKTESKSKVYDILKSNKDLAKLIPYYLNTDDNISILKILEDNRGKNNICLKFDKDEGGCSYRAIDDRRQTIDSLNSNRFNTLTTDEAERLLINCDAKQLIIMEKLDGPEVSVDCYRSKHGMIAICREKHVGRVQRIFYDEYISNICNMIGCELGLNTPYNVQFRYEHNENNSRTYDKLRLLEVNTRMSGGLYYEISEGLNIASVCLKDFLNKSDEYNILEYKNFEDKLVTHLELPISL